MQSELVPQVTTRDAIADAIKRDIVSGLLNLGQQIPESEYAERFKVSRTPVREAVLSLSTLGLVTVKSRSGSYVVRFTQDSLFDLFAARFHIEASSVRYASAKELADLVSQLRSLNQQMHAPTETLSDFDRFHDADTSFHRAFVCASGSARLLGMYEPIQICALAARSRLEKSRAVTELASEHHSELVDCLHRRDIDKFERVLRAHLDWVFEMLTPVVAR